MRQELNRLKPELEAADDPAAYVSANTYGDAEPAYVPPGGMSPELADAVYSDLTVGRTVGPVLGGDSGVLARITGVRPAESPSVHARHILFGTTDRQLAENTKARIEQGGLSFENAAQLMSQDESNKNDGGDLGWFSTGTMVKPFEDAALAAPVGQVVGPVETSFGYHLILVEAQTTQEAELVRLSVPLQSDDARLIEEAEDLQYYAEAEGSTFADEAQRRGLSVQQATLQEDQEMIPGLQLGSDALRWIRRANAGDISEPFDASTQFVVFQLTETSPAGVRPFDEVRPEIEPRVLLEKKKAVQAARLRDALATNADLAAVASAVGASVQTLENLSMANPVIMGIGREPAISGTIFGLEPGETSGVLEGEGAAFVVRTTAFQGGDIAQLSDEERQQIREQLLDRRRRQVLQAWIQSLRDQAEIEDFRDALR